MHSGTSVDSLRHFGNRSAKTLKECSATTTEKQVMPRGPSHGPWHNLAFAYPEQLQGAILCKHYYIHQEDPRIPIKKRKSTRVATLLRVIDVDTGKVLRKNVPYHVSVQGGTALEGKREQAEKKHQVYERARAGTERGAS